jgi:hypothetical protein
MSDYLYDSEGPPDPEVERLSRLLGPLRYRPPRRARRWPIAMAAVLAAAAVVAAVIGFRGAAWDVTGAARCGGDACHALAIGPWLETDDTSRAELTVADIGRMQIAPGTRLRRKAGAGHRLELAVGEISARVSAPPRLLMVETPTATAVDLGCAYTLRVSDGRTHLQVTFGWVALEAPGRNVFVPAGAEAFTLRDGGLGTPFFADAPAALRDALARVDADDAEAIPAALAAARPRDTLSLWHLVARVSSQARPLVVDRMLALGPPLPDGVTRERLLAADAAALERWRDQLLDTW